jgi:hypothetical protein
VARRKPLAISVADWQTILRATGPIPPTADVARARLEIGACRKDFRQLPIPRKNLLAARKELQRSDALLSRLIRSLEAAHRLGLGDLLLVIITDLEEHRKGVRNWIEDFDTLARSVEGRRDEANKWLYWRVLGIWTECLGGKLVISTARGRAPYGPLVRFFDAIVRPLLGDKAPGPHAIRRIVKQERRRRGEVAKQLEENRRKYGDGVVRVLCPPQNKFQNSI